MKLNVVTLASLLSLTLVVSSVRSQWMPTNGPGSGPAVTSLAIHEGKMFAGVRAYVGRDLFVSENAGKTWTPVSNVANNYPVTRLVSLKSYLFAMPSCGLKRSSDNGASWMYADSGINSVIYCLAVSGDTLFVGTGLDDSYVLPPSGSVFRSTNFGNSWTEINHGLPNTPMYAITAEQNSLIVQTMDSVFRSTDGGANWVQAESNRPTLHEFCTIGPTLLAATYSSAGVYRSRDGGATWQASNAGLKPDSSGQYVTNGFVTNGATIYLLGTGLYRSQDSGATWSAVNPNFNENVLSFLVSDSQWTVGCDRGLFLSYDRGVTWKKSVTGLPVGGIGAMAVIDSTLYAANFFRTTDNGANWVTADSDIHNGKANFIVSNDGKLFVNNGNFLQSPIRGKSLIFIDTGFPNTDERPIYCCGTSSSDILAIGDTIWAAVLFGVYRTVDKGLTWVGVNDGLAVAGMGPIVRHGSDLLLSVGNRGIYRSSNGGNSWYPSNAGIDTDKDAFFYFIVEGKHNLFASTGYSDQAYTNADYISRDDGHTWSPININLPGFNDFGTGIFSIGEGRIFLNSNLGLLYSSDDGETWAVENGLPDYNLPHTNVNSVAVLGQNLFVGTEWWGVWYRPLSDFGITASVSSHSKASAFIIYPNPTVASTTISFTPEASGYAEIAIVNTLGQEITRVYSGMLDASEHRFTWEAQAKACATGVYECVLRMNGRVQIVPIVVE